MSLTLRGYRMQPLTTLALIFVVATALGNGGTQANPVLPPGSADEATSKRIIQVPHSPHIVFDPPVKNTYLQTLSIRLKSKLVLDAAANDPTLASVSIVRNATDVTSALLDHLEVRVLDDPSQIEVSARGLDPSEGALVVDAVVRAFLDEVVTKERDRRLKHQESLRKIYQDYIARLQKKEAELRSMERSINQLSLDSEGPKVDRSIVEADLRDCLRQLRRIQLERAALDARGEAEEHAEPETDRESTSRQTELAVIDRQEQLLIDQRDRLAASLSKGSSQAYFRDALLKEIPQIEEKRDQIGNEIESLNVEMNAPPRVRLITPARP